MATTTGTVDLAPPSATTSWTATLWANCVLLLAGDPVNPTNTSNMLHWMAAENSGNSAWYQDNNPLNTGQGTGGGDGTGGAATLFQGAIDAADTLTTNNYGYPAIQAALRASAPLPVFAAAVGNSQWASGKYKGNGQAPGYTIANNPGTPGGSDTAPSTAGYVPQGNIAGIATDSETGAVGQGITGGLATGVAGAAEAALSPLETLEKDLTSAAFWKRIGVGAGGVALMIFGLVIVLSETKAGGDAANAAKLAAVA